MHVKIPLGAKGWKSYSRQGPLINKSKKVIVCQSDWAHSPSSFVLKAECWHSWFHSKMSQAFCVACAKMTNWLWPVKILDVSISETRHQMYKMKRREKQIWALSSHQPRNWLRSEKLNQIHALTMCNKQIALSDFFIVLTRSFGCLEVIRAYLCTNSVLT